jgi:hypothetical protein
MDPVENVACGIWHMAEVGCFRMKPRDVNRIHKRR